MNKQMYLERLYELAYKRDFAEKIHCHLVANARQREIDRLQKEWETLGGECVELERKNLN